MRMHLFEFAAVTALTAGMAVAQAPAPAPAPQRAPFTHPMFGHQQLLQALNLTPAQKQQADTIFGDARKSAEPIRQELRQNRDALYAAERANNTAQIDRLAAHQGELHGRMLAIHSGSMAKFYAILTPEQRTTADQMLSRMRQRMAERMRAMESDE